MFDTLTETVGDVLTSIFGTKSDRDLKKIWPIVEEVNEHYEGMDQR